MKKRSAVMAAMMILCAVNVFAGIPQGTLTFTVSPTVEGRPDRVTAWVPYPMSDGFQTVSNMKITGNCTSWSVLRDDASEAVYVKADWETPVEKPVFTMSFHVSQKDRKNTRIVDSKKEIPDVIRPYLESTEFVPSNDPEMKKIAKNAVKGKTGTLEKAMAIYDWVVENTFRDPAVKGCGLGLPVRTIQMCKGGGKCADLSSVFVTLARAAGIPARDVYGIRLAPVKDGDVTGNYHCWAEFYVPGTGWVMADPADVRKMMLVNKLELKDAGDWRTFFWGGDDLFRVVLERNARGVMLQGMEGNRLNYMMYPAAIVDGKPKDGFDPGSFSYTVSFKADKSV